MSYGRQVCLVTTILALAGLAVGNALAADRERGRPIEFSSPKSDEVTTNLHQLTSKKDSLRQLEEDLYKPLESFSVKGSLEGVAAPPPRVPSAPAVQSKRVKELLERRKNWGFMSPEDMFGVPTADEVLKTPQIGPNADAKKELPAFERYYHRLAKKRVGPANPLQSQDESLLEPNRRPKGREDETSADDSVLPAGVRESAQALSRLFEQGGSENPFAQAAKRDDQSDAYGLAENPLTKQQQLEHKKYMDDYRSILDPSWRPPTAAAPGVFSGSLFATLPSDSVSPAAKSPVVGLPSSPALPQRSALDVQMDIVNPQLGPTGLRDVTAQALGQTRSSSALPTVEPASVAPPTPSFAAPKRSFR